MTAPKNISFVDWLFKVGSDGAVATKTETRWLSSMAELDNSINAVKHSGNLVVFDIALNFATCAEKHDSKFLMFSELWRRVFSSSLNARNASLKTERASRC